MKRLFSHFSTACRGETGSVLPVLMLMSTLLMISGVAFLSIGSFQAKIVSNYGAGIKAKYNAEQAARISLWRIGHTAPDYWRTWASFGDSTYSASFDSVQNLLTVVGHSGGESDTVRAYVHLDPVPAMQDNYVIAYQTSFTSSGGAGTLTYPSGYGPHQVQQVPVLDTNYYRDHANFTYTEAQTFSAPLASGIHFINGNVTVKNGTTLTGALIATGTIKFQGQVTITATQTPSDSPFYPGFYPAVASLDTAQADINTDITGGNQNLNITGMLYARGTIDLNPCNITGVMIAKVVKLAGSYSVAYDSRFGPPPPGLVLWPSTYKPSISAWME